MEKKIDIQIPGSKLAHVVDGIKAGVGTYERDGIIYSSLVGSVQRETQDNGLVLISITSGMVKKVVPYIGCLVAAKVFSITPRFCKCTIVSVDGRLLSDEFHGIIRREDIRRSEKDKIKIIDCFRPSDLIVARVIYLGDAQSYILSTAENELGVVIATSEAGEPMIPISWTKMQCPRSLIKENRKVALVHPNFREYSAI